MAQNFEESKVRERVVPGFDPKGAVDRSPRPIEVPNGRRGRPADNQVEKYVPTFMKEVLAKSFLKDPENYLAKLRAKERAQEQLVNNLRPQLAGERNVRPRCQCY